MAPTGGLCVGQICGFLAVLRQFQSLGSKLAAMTQIAATTFCGFLRLLPLAVVESWPIEVQCRGKAGCVEMQNLEVGHPAASQLQGTV